MRSLLRTAVFAVACGVSSPAVAELVEDEAGATPEVPSEAVAEAPRGTVIFVHGLFMTGPSWAPWEARFQAAGWDTLAPSWPGREGEPAALRAAPPEALRALTLGGVVAHVRATAQGVEGPVVLVGHSMGGLVVQRLAAEGVGDAVIAIDAAPPRGVLTPDPRFVLSNRALLAPTRRPIVPSYRWYTTWFAHTLPEAEARQAYADILVPESRRVGKGALGRAGRVDFKAPRPPLLLVVGHGDRTVPADVGRRTARRWRRAGQPAEVHRVDEVSHWLILDAGWEALADTVSAWAEAQLAAPSAGGL